MYAAYAKHKRSTGGALEIKDDELSRLMWSIGDRYHDWWPASRGVIENYKNCGVWKMLPALIHYGIVCDSVIAFKKKYDRIMASHPPSDAASALNAGLLNDFYSKVPQVQRPNFVPLSDTSIHESTIDFVAGMENTDSEEKVEEYSWTDGNLTDSAGFTLTYFRGVSTIEDDILNQFTQGIPTISMNVIQPRTNLDNMITNYREICEQLFGDLTHVKWFAVLCDADIGPFCNLFINILESAKKLTLNAIKTYCTAKDIPVMYMIKTPQTMTDSSNNQSFMPCLTLYRFPITHIRTGPAQNFSQAPPQPQPGIQDMPHPTRNQPGIPANQAGIPTDSATFHDNYMFSSKLDSLAEEYTVSYRACIPAAAGFNPVMPYTFDEASGGSSFIYRIERPPSAVPNAAAAAQVTGLMFDIQYGNVSVQYRASGPSLGDLMLHYIHKNLKEFDSPENGFLPNSSSIFSKDIHYQGNPSIVFKRGIYNLPEYITSDDGKQIKKAIKPVHIYNKLKDIKKVVDSSLGIMPPDGKGDVNEDSYTIMPNDSLCRIPNYDEVPAVIMTVIKLLGDYDQAVAARVLNKTTEFYDRIVFCSMDRSCVAHSANNGVRTIQNMKRNEIIMYNCTAAPGAAPAAAASAAPASKKRKSTSKKGGGFKNTLDDCDNQCLDIKQTMLTAGMNASRYIVLYKKYIKPIKIDDHRHTDVLLNIYNEIRDKYNMYNRDLEYDITDFNVKYDNDMRVFMGILNDLYYNSINKNKSLKMLIGLCNIHNRNYMLPEIDYTKYIKNTHSLSQQLRNKLSQSHKKSSQSHKKSSQLHNKSVSHLREKILHQLHKKSSHSHKKSGQSRKKSSLHKIMAPVAGGF